MKNLAIPYKKAVVPGVISVLSHIIFHFSKNRRYERKHSNRTF